MSVRFSGTTCASSTVAMEGCRDNLRVAELVFWSVDDDIEVHCNRRVAALLRGSLSKDSGPLLELVLAARPPRNGARSRLFGISYFLQRCVREKPPSDCNSLEATQTRSDAIGTPGTRRCTCQRNNRSRAKSKSLTLCTRSARSARLNT